MSTTRNLLATPLTPLAVLAGVALLPLPAPTGAAMGDASALAAGTTDDDQKTKEYTLKAAFLYNFLKYTTWPEGTFEEDDDPIVLGVIGKDPFGKILDEVLDEKEVGDHPIVVRRLERVMDVKDVKDVHALFLGEMRSKQRKALYEKLADQAVLSVGDERGMAGKDGCVASFYLKKGNVRFEVSLKAVERATLSLSSQLLKLADVVEKKR